MNEMPDYSRYTWDQLQDALAHIKRGRYPIQYAALQDEITRRSGDSIFSQSLPSSSNGKRGAAAFYGWLGGIVIGVVAGHLWFLILAARLRVSGVNPYGHDDWGFGWLGCICLATLFCSVVGLCIGLSRERR